MQFRNQRSRLYHLAWINCPAGCHKLFYFFYKKSELLAYWRHVKLVHNFTVYYLVLISCLSNMVRTYITEANANNNIFCSYREKKNKFGNSENLGFPISPCATSLEGEFPRNRKYSCV